MKIYRKTIVKLLILLILVLLFLKISPIANASFFDNIKKLMSNNSPKKLSLDSNIKLLEDLNKNGQIDGEDTLKFSYIISNPTEKEYSFVVLKTNIPRNYLHFIHNIQGTVNLSDKNNSIIIPNLRINPGQKLEISFEAQVNYFPDADKIISTEPEIISSEKKLLLKSAKREISVKRFREKLPSALNTKIK